MGLGKGHCVLTLAQSPASSCPPFGSSRDTPHCVGGSVMGAVETQTCNRQILQSRQRRMGSRDRMRKIPEAPPTTS